MAKTPTISYAKKKAQMVQNRVHYPLMTHLPLLKIAVKSRILNYKCEVNDENLIEIMEF